MIPFLCFALAFGMVRSARAQGEVEVIDHQVDYQFGKRMTFQARVSSSHQIDGVELILEIPGTPTFVGAAAYHPSGQIDFTYNLEQRPLRAFATVSYSYRFKLADGGEVRSESYSFPYLDNRFQWQTLENGKFAVYWTEGDVPFAQEIVDAAEAGREKVLELLQRPRNSQRINIYVYASQEDLQTTLAASGVSWVGGHADPELGSAAVALPPGPDRSLEVQRQIPHEITHIMLYRFMGAGYQYLPRWVNEGIASHMELFPNPEFDDVLDNAYRDRSLIPISQMCRAFPADPELITLAYAESDSILSYIVQEYGINGIRALISAYDQGVGCSRGVEIALGTDLVTLETSWKREVFGGGVLARIRSSGILLPFLLLLAALLLAAIFVFQLFLHRRGERGENQDV